MKLLFLQTAAVKIFFFKSARREPDLQGLWFVIKGGYLKILLSRLWRTHFRLLMFHLRRWRFLFLTRQISEYDRLKHIKYKLVKRK